MNRSEWLQQYDLNGKIGVGAYGLVFLAKINSNRSKSIALTKLRHSSNPKMAMAFPQLQFVKSAVAAVTERVVVAVTEAAVVAEVNYMVETVEEAEQMAVTLAVVEEGIVVVVELVVEREATEVITKYSCGNLNFSWRTECNKCGTPSPAGSGGGGGDRGLSDGGRGYNEMKFATNSVTIYGYTF